jgi:uncharacterized Rmd1/YagE family protein
MFKAMDSSNMLKYFSTTGAVKNKYVTNYNSDEPQLNRRGSKGFFFKQRGKVKPQAQRTQVRTTKLVNPNCKVNPYLMQWYNKRRSVSRNWFKYYYYDRKPLCFFFYPFAYRLWILRRVIKPSFKKAAKKYWRKTLYRRYRKLRYLTAYCERVDYNLNELMKIFNNLTNPDQNLMPKKKTQKFKKKLNILKWQQLLQAHVENQELGYARYQHCVNRFSSKYVVYKPRRYKKRPKVLALRKSELNNLVRPYMLNIKFYKTQRVYFTFRRYRYKGYHMKKLKWIYKKRVSKRRLRMCKTKKFRTLRTKLYYTRRYPYRLRKFARAYNCKRFSYYWLRYFFKRFKQIYIDNKNAAAYNQLDIKNYLASWLMKVRTYKFLSLHNVNPARGFLSYKSNKLYNDLKVYGLFRKYEMLTMLHDRNEIDDLFKSLVRKNRYLYRNFYWRFYKSTLERKKANILKKNYYYTWGLRPYIFVHKKHKMFYNWADRHIFKRYPLHRYKYTAFFKFPRFADYRRLFKNQLREQHVFRYLYRLKLGQLIKAFRKATYKTKRIFELMFLKYFELRLDTVVYRLHFAWSLKHARQLVLRGLFVVNNKVVDNHKYHVGLCDVIMPIKRLRMQPLSKKYLNYVDYGVSLAWTRLFYRPLQTDQYPDHFFLNERIPAGMIVNKFNPNILRFNKPYSVQFLTLSLLKYS